MKKVLALLLSLVPAVALAQSAGWPPPAGAIAFLGVYNTVQPTLTNGQIGFAQLDASGNLNVNVKAGSGSGCAGTTGTPCFVNVQNWGAGGTALGAIANFGTSPGAVAVPGVNSYVFNTSGTPIYIDTPASGNLYTAVTSAIPAGTNKIGTIDPATIATWGLMSGTSPGTAPTNTQIVGGKYNSTPPTVTDGQTVPLQVGPHGGLLLGGAGYPSGATPITVSATGTTGATTATLATGASVTTYICGFSIRANATAAATGNATVTGTITGTLNYTQWTAPNASGLGVTEQIFTPCIPASAVNTGIAVVSAAPGGGGVVSVTAWGFTL